MTGPHWPTASTYVDGFRRAALLLEDKKYVRPIFEAKFNMCDLLLPPYWQLKNCLIVIIAEDEWEEAQRFIDIAEEIWRALPNPLSDLLLAPFREDLDMYQRHQDREAIRLGRLGAPCSSNEDEPIGTGSPPSKVCLAAKMGELQLGKGEHCGADDCEDEEEDPDLERRDRWTEPDAIEVIRETMKPGSLRETRGGSLVLDKNEHCRIAGCRFDFATEKEMHDHQLDKHSDTPQGQLLQIRRLMEEAKHGEDERQQKHEAREQQCKEDHCRRQKLALQEQSRQVDAALSLATAMNNLLPGIRKRKNEIDEELARLSEDDLKSGQLGCT